MATSFRGWADAWGNSLGSVVTDPNAMRGSASFSFLAALQVNSGEMQGSASFSITAELQLVEPPRNWSAEVDLLAKRKWYVKRRKQIHVFDSAEDADAFIQADDAAEKAIQEAQKTSRRARKRARARVIEAKGIAPSQTVSIDLVAHLVSLYQLDFNIPELIAQQDYEMFLHVARMAQEIEEEELLLLA